MAEVFAGSRAVRVTGLPPETTIWPIISTIHLEPALRGIRGPDQLPPITLTADDGPHDEYEVEEIIGRRVYHGTIQYHVKWKGYAIEQAIYEPRANLGNSKALVRDYDLKHASPPKPRTRQQGLAGRVQVVHNKET